MLMIYVQITGVCLPDPAVASETFGIPMIMA
jgi:hypothetical protein